MAGASWIQDIEEFIPRTLADFAVPGLAIAVLRDDEVLYCRGFGTRRLGQAQPVDEHTSFAIASVSKSTVAVSLAMLVDEQRLCWDDPVRKYLPDFELYNAFVGDELRVRDLLIHNCGLKSVSGGTIWYGSDLSREEVVQRLRYLKPVSSFRSQFAYQNVTYLVAGQIIHAITGVSWDDFVRQRIFAPLGMLSSTTSLAGLDGRTNVATPHARIRGEVQPIPYRNHDNVGPAASINSSAWDLAQYLRVFINGGVVAGQRLLSQQAVMELWSPQMIIPVPEFAPSLERLRPNFYAYGLGWFLRDYCGRKLVNHSGGVDGMRCLLLAAPAERLGIVVLTNQEERNAYASVVYRVLDALLGLPPYDWGAAFLLSDAAEHEQEQEVEQARWAGHQSGTTPSLPLDRYAGVYRDVKVDEIYVELVEGRLVLRFRHTPAFVADLVHWHFDTFRLNWRDAYIPAGLVTFNLNARAEITGMQLDQPSLLDVDFSELDIRRS